MLFTELFRKITVQTIDYFVVNSFFCEPHCIISTFLFLFPLDESLNNSFIAILLSHGIFKMSLTKPFFHKQIVYNELPYFSPGDYVISINDVNVQESNKSDVERLISECLQELKLVLRKPVNRSEHKVTLYPDMESLEKMGLKLSLVAGKANNNINHSCIKDGDTILKVKYKFSSL